MGLIKWFIADSHGIYWNLPGDFYLLTNWFNQAIFRSNKGSSRIIVGE
jgi:hypothetical protein